MNDGVIGQYKQMQEEMDKLILKKQAESILEASKAKYDEAITNRTQKTQELIDKEDELSSAKREQTRLAEELAEIADKQSKNPNIFNTKKLNIATEKLKNQKDAVNSIQTEVDSLNNTINGYSNDISDYEYKQRLYFEGTEESINQLVNSTTMAYEKDGEQTSLNFKRRIIEQQRYNDEAKALHDEAIKNNNQAEAQKTEITMNESRKRLLGIAEELKGMTSIQNENSEEVIDGWKQLANNSYDVYFDIVSQYPEGLRNKIQEMTGVTLEQTPELSSATGAMMEQVLNAMDKDTSFRQEAISNLQSFLNGMSDEQLRNLLVSAGVCNTEKVMQGIRQGNLAENEGRQILNSLKNGLNDNSILSSLFGSARGIANKLTGLLSVKAKVSADGLPGHKSGLDYVPYDNYVARLHKGERVLTAKENQEYMSDSIRNKVTTNNIATRNITVQFYPQTMTETELKRAEIYITKKWGTQYGV